MYQAIAAVRGAATQAMPKFEVLLTMFLQSLKASIVWGARFRERPVE